MGDIGEALGGEGGEGGIGLELNASTFALLVGADVLDYAPADTPVAISIEPLLPPVARIGGPDGETMQVIIADMMIGFSLKPPTVLPSTLRRWRWRWIFGSMWRSSTASST